MDYSSSVETVAWFNDRYREGSLTLKPPYQRKPVWLARQKCYLIESILLSLPVPEIYIQQTTSADGRSQYAIVDGQQRIRTVLQFIGSEQDPEEQEFNKFALDKLDTASPWRNVSFGELRDEDRKKFFAYRFIIRYLNTDDDDAVRDMFRRINKYLTPLKPQELRNALYSGPFIQLAFKLADDEYWSENGIVKPASIRRMIDVEFVSELLIGVLHGPQGGSAKIIDDYYAQYEDFEDDFPGQRTAEGTFATTLETLRRFVPQPRQVRWGNKTDFYSLFLAIAAFVRTGQTFRGRIQELRTELRDLALAIDARLADENVSAEEEVIAYVRAVEKGANDKKRRADRHVVLTQLLQPFFAAAAQG